MSDIQRVVALAKDSESRFVEMVSKQSRKEIEKSVKRAKAEYARAENRIAQLDGIITQIYEDKVSGEISAERFSKMLAGYEREQVELATRLDELRPQIDEAEEDALNTDRFLRIVKSYTKIETLTAEVVSEFIEKIVVGETVMVQPRRFSHWADEKRQNIRIVYNYIGDAPQEVESLTANANGKKAYGE